MLFLRRSILLLMRGKTAEMIKKFFPLWFADIITTEERLAKLSQQGMLLTDFSPVSGVFTFEEGAAEDVRYRICSAKNCGGNPPKGLLAGGWEKVCGTKNYYVVKHSDKNTENVPSYAKWKTANRIYMLICFMLLCFSGGFCGGFAAAAADDGRNPFQYTFFTVYTIIAVIMTIAIIIGYKGNRRLAKTDTDFKLSGKLFKTIPQENFIYSKAEEKQMLKNGTMMKKSPIGWFYAPDKAEEMVERMALEGWKFYRLNEAGTVFYFIKSEPCRLKFVVDYQNEATDEYFLSAKDDGWKLEFTSITRIQSFVIWSQEYEGDTPPEFYTDAETTLKRARRMAYTFGFPMLIIAAGAVFVVAKMFGELAEDLSQMITLILIYAVLAVEYGIFSAKTIGYYIRMRKKYKNK